MTAHPDPFSDEAISAETTAHNARTQAVIRERVWPPVSAAAYRAALDERLTALSGGAVYKSPLATSITVEDGLPGKLRLRLIRRANCSGVYLYFHGGGWCAGGADQQDMALEELAASADMSVVSVDYRLAPEHPFPAGLDDAERAAHWLLRKGRTEFGTTRFIIGGDSAGANLALGALLRLRESGDHRGFAAASFLYGWFDATLTPSASVHNRQAVLTREMLEWYVAQYLPAHVDRADPAVSPLRAQLHDLPRTLLTIGTHDALLDDSLFLGSRLKAAGVPTHLHIAPGADHAFDMAPIEPARQAKRRIREFLIHS
jgi:acetyl esterase